MQFKVELFTPPSPAAPGLATQQHPLVSTSYTPAVPGLWFTPPDEQSQGLGAQALAGRGALVGFYFACSRLCQVFPKKKFKLNSRQGGRGAGISPAPSWGRCGWDAPTEQCPHIGVCSQLCNSGPNPVGALSRVASNIATFPKSWQTPSVVLRLPGDAIGAMAQTAQETPEGEVFVAHEKA